VDVRGEKAAMTIRRFMQIVEVMQIVEAIDDDDIWRYLHDECWAFAIAVHHRTGWPLAWITEEREGLPLHGVVVHPSGRYVDASGFVDLATLKRRYRIRKPKVDLVSEDQMGYVGGVEDRDVEEATSFLGTLKLDPFLTESSDASFKAWFGNSKVVDGVGRPLRVYHGTRSNFDQFRHGQKPRNPYLWNDNGLGFFFTANPGRRSDSGPWSGAAGYAGVTQRDGEPNAPEGSNIVPAFLAIRKPYVVGYADYINEVEAVGGGEAYRQRLESLGHDGVFRQSAAGKGVDAYVAFYPDQIRSAVGVVADEPVRDVDLWEGITAHHITT